MKTSLTANLLPTAHVAINKSRLKAYNATTEPTYYLKDGSEFQIELFNPTTSTILAKIKLDGEFITQGGLVLRPGERVFLERYIDVAKKFLFETYEVSSKNEEVKEAIKNNGNLVVEFFKEIKKPSIPIWGINNTGGINSRPFNGRSLNDFQWNENNQKLGNYNIGTGTEYLRNIPDTNIYNSNIGNTAFYSSNLNCSTPINEFFDSNVTTMDWMSQELSLPLTKSSNIIETGRVEMGSNSNQELTTVDKNFAFYAFHKISAKLLPVSQKINAVEDTIKSYCTECGCKQKKGFKFCPTCGTKN